MSNNKVIGMTSLSCVCPSVFQPDCHQTFTSLKLVVQFHQNFRGVIRNKTSCAYSQHFAVY